MSTTVARTDISTVGRWWWTVDKWILAATTLLILIGIILNFAAGPPAAGRIGAETFHFVRRQMVFLPLTIMVIFAISLMAPIQVRRFAVIGFGIMLFLMILTLLTGIEVKGAKRWIYIAGMSLQPSEFIKPFLCGRGRLDVRRTPPTRRFPRQLYLSGPVAAGGGCPAQPTRHRL